MAILHLLLKHRHILFILIFVVILLGYNIRKPFIGHHDWNGAFWGSMTRNYMSNLGKIIGNTYLQNLDQTSTGDFIFFYHYTPLLPVFFTVSGLVFGLNEISMRLVTVVFSVLMLISIYKIGACLYSKNIGILAAVFALITPMFLYFGKLPDHEPILTALCTITFYFYLRLTPHKPISVLRFFILMALTLLESWGGFFFLTVIMVHGLLTKKLNRKLMLGLTGLGLGVLLFHALMIFAIYGKSTILDFFNYGLIRMNMSEPGSNVTQFTWIQFIMTESRFLIVYFTRILVGLSAVWIIYFFLKLRKHALPSDLLLFLLFVYGFFFILVFRNLAYIHDYKLYVLLPFIALSSARTILFLFNSLGNRISVSYPISKWMNFRNSLIALIVLAVAWERTDFIVALQKTSFNTPGFELGNLIRSNTSPEEKTLVLSQEFDSFYGVFIKFYSNRSVSADDVTLQQFKENPDRYSETQHFVLVDNRPVDSEMENYILTTYRHNKTGKFTLVDLIN